MLQKCIPTCERSARRMRAVPSLSCSTDWLGVSAARSMPRPFAPVATVVGAMLLAVICVGWLLYFIHHISHAISVNFIIDRIAAETEAVIDQIMPAPRKDQPTSAIGVSAIKWDGAILS